ATGETTRFIYDGHSVIEEYDGYDNLLRKFVNGQQIDEPRVMIGPDYADVDGDENTTEEVRLYFHADQVGSIVAVTAPDETVVEQYEYLPYGEVTIKDGQGTDLNGSSAILNPFMFTARRFDEETELYHYRHRAYDPVAGRFLQRDPLGYVDGPNLLEYATSRPPCLIDPLGLATIVVVKEQAEVRSTDLNTVLNEASDAVLSAKADNPDREASAQVTRDPDTGEYVWNGKVYAYQEKDDWNHVPKGPDGTSPEGLAWFIHSHPRGSPNESGLSGNDIRLAALEGIGMLVVTERDDAGRVRGQSYRPPSFRSTFQGIFGQFLFWWLLRTKWAHDQIWSSKWRKRYRAKTWDEGEFAQDAKSFIDRLARLLGGNSGVWSRPGAAIL
ncbi:MAG: hypothetical protein GF355_06015, partial [Candidatus Eisenbacteria bacterium]|nr:hypothetical protein [Candidatus Eisenbacteria bacterium]